MDEVEHRDGIEGPEPVRYWAERVVGYAPNIEPCRELREMLIANHPHLFYLIESLRQALERERHAK